MNIWDRNFNLIATVPAVYEGQTLSYTVPLTAFGNDDGNIDTVMVIGDFSTPARLGSGRRARHDPGVRRRPVAHASASSGVVPAGQSDVIDLALGDDALPPGDYTASLVIRSDAPRRPAVTVDVHLEVRRPASWGAISGVVRDAHRRSRLEDAKLIVHARWKGARLDLTAHTDDRGMWRVQGPEGVWRAELHHDGYVPVSMEGRDPHGTSTIEGNNATMHEAVPHATMRAGAIDLTLLHGQGRRSCAPLGTSRATGRSSTTWARCWCRGARTSGGGGGPVGRPSPGVALAEGTREDAHTSRSLGHRLPGARRDAAPEKGELHSTDGRPTCRDLGAWGTGRRASCRSPISTT